ncbi:MAG: ATP-binding cassette domain-containing protein [Clostridiales bacterium]|nr:ATP-binding cassette domain-containing protein [Clostridiales bacterium]
MNLTDMCILTFDNVSKKYPYVKEFLFKNLSFSVSKGQRVGIVAEKQCGKSSVVKIIAQLTKQTEGQVLLDGKDLFSVPVNKRGIGIVFDDFALMPGKTVEKNVAFPLKVRKEQNIEQKTSMQIEKFGLQSVAKTKTKKLLPVEKLATALARLDSRTDIELVVFDDLFAKVDRQQALPLINLFLNDREVGILQTSSEIDHLTECDVVHVVADGTIAFTGSFDEAKNYIERTKCFDKFGINEDIKKVLQDN